MRKLSRNGDDDDDDDDDLMARQSRTLLREQEKVEKSADYRETCRPR